MTQILTVDDDHIMLVILKTVLTKEGYHVTQVKNGKEAIALKDRFAFDLVICDLMMPYANGYEVLSSFRNDPVTANTPIIILSSIGNTATIEEVLSLGANEFISKPFTSADLLHKIKTLLNTRKQTNTMLRN
ncbi:Response regulator receiver domain-containing protein [Hydrobacter penzbergensis]|jgi:CheY-like chemotaxis protein|uniref:Response regulator receiver domain-containing protein n=1 Tax=Hydrobacter penzbergensis TaxID=1235997 RepID=A0A8X8I975_9BACT|nr:response regulator [Hydrobacter penzbergensis]SDW22734.1 Response regulator receiver domain-containing protein [Hydrobacter penzbergensis]